MKLIQIVRTRRSTVLRYPLQYGFPCQNTPAPLQLLINIKHLGEMIVGHLAKLVQIRPLNPDFVIGDVKTEV